jgi:hypothetical protein
MYFSLGRYNSRLKYQIMITTRIKMFGMRMTKKKGKIKATSKIRGFQSFYKEKKSFVTDPTILASI